MIEKVKKLYLVKREVIATSIQQAMREKGTIYEIVVTDKKDWPEPPTKIKGFNKKL